MTTTRETWPCPTCGHKHFASQACADHPWTDYCPYEGLECKPAAEREKLVAADTAAVRGQSLDDLISLPED